MPRFGEQLRRLIADRHLTQREFCERAGIASDTLARALKAESPRMNQTTYRAIAAALELSPTDLDRQWRGGRVPQQLHEDVSQRNDIPVFTEVPAGNGDFDPQDLGEDNGIAEYTLPRRLVGIEDPTAFAVMVRGDSMAPRFQEGDVVFCSPQAPHASGMTAVYRLDDGTCGLKIAIELKDGRLELRPLNDRHPTKIVDRESVVRLARVIGRYERISPSSDFIDVPGGPTSSDDIAVTGTPPKKKQTQRSVGQ